MKHKQFTLFPLKSKRTHGGSTQHRKRKERRPVDRKKFLHVVMRSSKARGAFSMKSFDKQAMVEQTVREYARRCGVSIAAFANVGNHLHILIRFQNRTLFKKWMRVITGLLARRLTGARKGKRFGKFWDALAYTRIVVPGRDERNVMDYITANVYEAEFGKWVRELFLKDRKQERQRRRW